MELIVVAVFALVAACVTYGISKQESIHDVQKNRLDSPIDSEYKAGTDKSMPHVDLETTKGITLETNEKDEMNNYKTRGLFIRTLRNIGCQYEKEEDGDRIFFAYQGENFVADVRNGASYIQIWDTHWGHVELYDIDEFTRLKKAVNGSNLNNSVTTIYTIDEDGKNVDVHCKSVILFIPQIPNLEDYLRLELNEFFRAHQYVGNEMAKLREKEELARS